jgi:hypothetical protein
MQIPVASWSEPKHAGLLRDNAPNPASSAQNKKDAHMATSPGQNARRRERIRYVKI